MPEPKEPVATPSYVEQYEIGDEAPSASAPAAGPAPQPPAHIPPKDPATGRFVSHHHPRTLRLAKEFGISEEEIAQTPPEELREWVRDIKEEQRFKQLSDSFSARQDAPPSGVPNGAPAPEDEFDIGLDAEQYDPSLVGAFKKLHARMAEQIKALKDELGEVKGHQARQAQESLAQRADRWFAKNESRYGPGRGVELAKDSPQYKRRLALFAYIEKFGDRKVPLERALADAEATLYGEAAPPTPKPPEETEEMRAWREGGLARPTQRGNAAELPGEDKAKRTVKQYFRENGVDEPTAADEFLG